MKSVMSAPNKDVETTAEGFTSELLVVANFKPFPFANNSAWRGHLPFAAWLTRVFKPTVIVELGSHWGHSYFTFCQAVSEANLPTSCYAVDTWQGDEHAGNYGDEVFAFVDTHNKEHYAKFSHLLRMTFDDALDKIPDGTVELLHIDGLHTYEAVKHDFETWKVKLAPGAVVLFHDTYVREREFGVWQLWEELQAVYPNNLAFAHSSGLGVLQIDGALGEKKMAWLDTNNPSKQDLKDYFSALGARLIEQFDLGVMSLHAKNLSVELGWRDEWLLGRDQQLANTNQELAQRTQELAQRTQELAQRTQELGLQKQQGDAQLQNIYASTSWRITRPMRIIRRLGGLLITGNFGEIWRLAQAKKKSNLISRFIPNALAVKLQALGDRVKQDTSQVDSSMNLLALQAIVGERLAISKKKYLETSTTPSANVFNAVDIDISLVTYNSGKWLARFFASVEQLDYPLSYIKIYALDNGSTDDTVAQLKETQKKLETLGIEMHIAQGPNVGFGAGHNANCKLGHASLLLVSNVDLFFEPASLKEVVAQANQDDQTVAAWEFRQKPYEHPKYYDPVSGLTNWNAHACVLMRRAAFEAVGGYDENIFMYGEDVDLSYNFRAKAYLIKYAPKAVVWHDTYADVGEVKPVQYAGSTFASLYLRLKYGTMKDVLAIPALQSMLLNNPPPYAGAHDAVRANGKKLLVKAISGLTKRQQTKASFPFRAFDYDLTRAGAFHKLEVFPSEVPLVSIITRTYAGRSTYLQQAILSVANQTYPNIEHIIVEDGGNSHAALCQHAAQTINPRLKYLSLAKVGRCVAGNSALEAAKGRYCLFLDDDDLLFADHIEVLCTALIKEPSAVGAYSPAMEIHTEVVDKDTGEYIETQYSFPAGLSQEYSFEKLRQHNYIAIQSILFDRQLYVERGGFDTSLDYLEDWNLWVRYGWNNTFVYVPKLTSMYRVPASETEFQRRFDLLNGSYAAVCQSNADALARLGMRDSSTAASV
jgi:GT2 family glycosyltransferase